MTNTQPQANRTIDCSTNRPADGCYFFLLVFFFFFFFNRFVSFGCILLLFASFFHFDSLLLSILSVRLQMNAPVECAATNSGNAQLRISKSQYRNYKARWKQTSGEKNEQVICFVDCTHQQQQQLVGIRPGGQVDLEWIAVGTITKRIIISVIDWPRIGPGRFDNER